MAPKPWASDEQGTWLHSRLQDFITRQAEGKLHLFWPSMYEAWFRKYPEHSALGLPMANDTDARPLTADELGILGAKILGRRKQIETWFRYQRKKTAISVTPQATASTVMRKMFKEKAGKRRRPHKATELFSKRNKALVDQALRDEGYFELTEEKMAEDVEDWENEDEEASNARLKSAKSARMRMRTQVTTAVYLDASDEEKAAIAALIEVEREEILKEELTLESFATSKGLSETPEEFQEGIDQLDTVFREVHSAAHELAGWVGISLMGGPNPRMPDGELSLKVICFGKTPAGNDFEDVCIDFDKNVQEPFEAFLRTVFTPQQRKSRALPGRSSSPAAEERLDRGSDDPVPAPVLPPVKAKKPKRMTKAKSKKTNGTFPAQMAVSAAASDSNTLPSTGPDHIIPAVASEISPRSEEAAIEDDPFQEDNEDLVRGDTFLRDDYLFDNSTEQNFNPWPAGMSPPLSPGSAAVIARRERGGVDAASTMMIDPVLLGLTPPTPTPRTMSAAEAFKPSGLFDAFRGTRSKTPPALPTTKAWVPPPQPSRIAAPPGFSDERDYDERDHDDLPPNDKRCHDKPDDDEPDDDERDHDERDHDERDHDERDRDERDRDEPDDNEPDDNEPDDNEPDDNEPDDNERDDHITRAPGAPRPKPVPKGAKARMQVAAKEAAAKEAAAKDVVKEGAKKRGRPRKNGTPENTLDTTTNTAGTSRPRGRQGWSAQEELRKYYELNVALQPTPPEVLPPPRAASDLQLLPNPNGATPSILVPRTRKPAKLADGSEVQRQVKGKRVPVNPHAATEEKLLARSAAAKAKAAGGAKRKAAADENGSAPKQKNHNGK
ncbi:hypothetical protein B0H15DRAFT_804886 [Mycena belliarum]|uniref:Uncharacterized protein n=1 Tax=Mycena belliarum TaxID=1033014 RepID=A0AAD6TVY1_9AGAR|nr:hypothetical protein B0H15DRAFT_804886 [Mycena belliae]